MSAAPLLSIKGVTKRFGQFTAVDRISFDLNSGVIAGLIGPNGAGKTTLFDTLAKHEINIQLVSTSEIKISVAISPESAEKATRLIHSAYGLDTDA